MLDKMPVEVRQRVELELSELSAKITKLRAFIARHQKDEVNPDVGDLRLQLNAMCEYAMILEKRLAKDSAKRGDSYISSSVYNELVEDVQQVISDMRKETSEPTATILGPWMNRLTGIIPKGEK